MLPLHTSSGRRHRARETRASSPFGAIASFSAPVPNDIDPPRRLPSLNIPRRAVAHECQGEATEAAFMAKASNLGFAVAKPGDASATTSSSTPAITLESAGDVKASLYVRSQTVFLHFSVGGVAVQTLALGLRVILLKSRNPRPTNTPCCVGQPCLFPLGEIADCFVVVADDNGEVSWFISLSSSKLFSPR